jgi:hypothetical protein
LKKTLHKNIDKSVVTIKETDSSAVNAQGIGAVSFFAGGKKDTSVKPGPCAVLPYGQVGARMRPELKKLYVYPGAAR